MTETEAKEQLLRVFTAYPTIRRELEGMQTGNETLKAWCLMLVHCDIDDVRSVVDEIVSGDREPYGRFEKFDSTPRMIRAEANDRRSKRNARQKQQDKYHDACNSLRASDRKLGKYWRVAMQLGILTRDRVLTSDENEEMMSALRQWYLRGADYPQWIHEVIEEKLQATT